MGVTMLFTWQPVELKIYPMPMEHVCCCMSYHIYIDVFLHFLCNM